MALSFDNNSNPKRVFGLSTDTKPVNYLIGAVFIETDTGNRFIYSGDAWGKYIEPVSETYTSLIRNNIFNYGVKCAVIGDSISDTNYTNPRNFDSKWYSLALYGSNKVVSCGANAGKSGDTTQQMLNRLYADVIVKNPNFCFVLAGTNDLGANVPVNTITKNIETILFRLMDANISPVLCTVLPRNPASTYSTRIIQLNQKIRNLSIKHRVTMLDFYSVVVNVNNGELLSTYSDDGLHPNSAGKKVLSDYTLTNFYQYLPQSYLPLFEANTNTSNLFTNGLFLIDTSGDGVPDNWTKSVAGTCALIDDATIKGKWAKLTKNSSSTARLIGTFTTGFSAGDTIRFSGLIKTENFTAEAVGEYALMISYVGSAITEFPIQEWDINLSKSTVVWDFVVPEGVTSISMQLYIQGSGLVGDVYLSQMGMQNLTTLGLLE